MEKLDGYKVDLKGMTSDTVSYHWKADNDFFSAVQGPEIKQGSLDVALRVKRTSGAYELEFQLKGEVEVTCDRCLEPMSQPIDAQATLKVVMGDDYADDGETVTVPQREGARRSAAYRNRYVAETADPFRRNLEGIRRKGTGLFEAYADPACACGLCEIFKRYR